VDAGGLDETNTFNLVNELLARDLDSDTNDDETLVYDKAGHLTDDGRHYTYEYDAFGRLRRVVNRDTDDLVAEYRYNGLGFRTGRHSDVTDDGTTGDPDGVVDGDDPWFWFCYDESWRIVAVFRAEDEDPKEVYVHHNAGLDGHGASSYIDAVVLRDRDANTAWHEEADGTLEERVYYCQNWRADVVALFSSAGHMLQQVRYDPYGVPFGISKADLTADGVVDSADSSLFVTLYNSGSGTHPFADWNLDGTLNSQDPIAYLNSYNADVALGYGVLGYGFSRAGGANRKAYAGYEIDPVLTGANGRESVYHVRHRVLLSELGRWNRRDPLGYVDGMSLYEYVESTPMLGLDPFGLAWSNWHFVNHFYNGGGTVVNLGAIGLGLAYESHPAVQAKVNNIIDSVMIEASASAIAMLASLDCSCSSQIKRLERSGLSVGNTGISTSSFIAPLLAELDTALDGTWGGAIGALTYFWYVDWLFSIGGHQLHWRATCGQVADCSPGTMGLPTWGVVCNFEFEMRDRFQDPADLAEFINTYIRRRYPPWGQYLQVNPSWQIFQFGGTPYDISYTFWRSASDSGYMKKALPLCEADQ